MPVTRQETKTYVLRSMGCGTMRVQCRLNAGLAMIECCAANNPISNKLIPTAVLTDPSTVESMDLGHQQIADEAN